MAAMVLALDIAGRPKQWVTPKQAVSHFARDEIVWSVGDPFTVFHGGINRASGNRSTVAVPGIIAVRGEHVEREPSPYLSARENKILFARDRWMCGYCGDQPRINMLTRDHIVPLSMGGSNAFTNIICACVACNARKGAKTPEMAKMPLLFVPYIPNRAERLILANRNVLADQMTYLAAKLPKGSRALQ